MEWMEADSKEKGMLKLDPRTKIILTFTVGFVTVLGGSSPVMDVFKLAVTVVPILLMFFSKNIGRALTCLFLYLLCSFSASFLIPLTSGFLNLMLSAICVVFLRFMPVIIMAWYMVSTTKVSEFMSAMDRMHVTQKIVIPLSVIFRFLPTVKEEYVSINDAMRMRGVSFGGGKVTSMLEYRLVPMMVCSVKIGEELSAAALTRGLGAPVRRTNICKIGFGFIDTIAILLCISALICLILNKLGVI